MNKQIFERVISHVMCSNLRMRATAVIHFNWNSVAILYAFSNELITDQERTAEDNSSAQQSLFIELPYNLPNPIEPVLL